MKVSIILCTYNRCQSLSLALESISSQTLPDSFEWEVLVIDNNSPDKTREVVEDFSKRYVGRFRYLFESRQGKSFALNTGIREAKGDVLAFMDDDVTVEPTWVQNITANLSTGEWAGAGGRIFPAKSFTPPPWLSLDGPLNMGGMLALFDLGDEPCELREPPFGTNMAFHKWVFEKHGGFRTDLGPCPGSEIRNEDTEFGRRLLSANERLRYEPSAVVFHAVPESRLTQKYLLRFWFDHGRASVREAGRKPDICGIPRAFFSIPKLMGIILLKALSWFVTVNPQRRFFSKAFVWHFAGQIVEIYHQSLRNDETEPRRTR